MNRAQFTFRLESEVLDAIQSAAKARRQSLSAFLRDAALAAIDAGSAAGQAVTRPACGCGQQDGLAWITVNDGSVAFSRAPSATTTGCPWMGWKCRRCCLRDHGTWFQAGAAA